MQNIIKLNIPIRLPDEVVKHLIYTIGIIRKGIAISRLRAAYVPDSLGADGINYGLQNTDRRNC